MSSTVTDAEIAAIEADLQGQLMPDTANILERVLASDNQGGYTETLKARASGVECGWGPLKQRSADAEGDAGGGSIAVAAWLFRMPAGTVVKPSDVVEAGGQKFEVVQMRSPRGAWSFLTRFEAVLFDVGGEVTRE